MVSLVLTDHLRSATRFFPGFCFQLSLQVAKSKKAYLDSLPARANARCVGCDSR